MIECEKCRTNNELLTARQQLHEDQTYESWNYVHQLTKRSVKLRHTCKYGKESRRPKKYLKYILIATRNYDNGISFVESVRKSLIAFEKDFWNEHVECAEEQRKSGFIEGFMEQRKSHKKQKELKR